MRAEKTGIVAEGLEFPEGPAFAPDGTLYWVNLEGGYLSRLTGGRLERVWHYTGGRPNGLALHQDGSLFVADSGAKCVWRLDPATKLCRPVADRFAGGPLLGPNDLCFDPRGNLYFTDPHGSGPENSVGRVLRRAAGGEVTLVLGGLAYPNGLALSPDGRVLYLAETRRRRVLRLELGGRGEVLGEAVYAEGLEGGPDGMALDESGYLYVALYGGVAVAVVPPGGSPGASVEHLGVDGPNPTNLAFRGRQLFITEAFTGTVQVLDVPRPGPRLFSGA